MDEILEAELQEMLESAEHEDEEIRQYYAQRGSGAHVPDGYQPLRADLVERIWRGLQHMLRL